MDRVARGETGTRERSVAQSSGGASAGRHGTAHRRRPGALAAIVALALAVRVGFVLWAPTGALNDSVFYRMFAAGLLAGRGYVNVDGSPHVKWMPGYPALLAGLWTLTGQSERAATLAGAVLGAGATGLVGALGLLCFARPVALAAALLYALWPGVIYYTALTMTETPASFFVLLFVVLLARAAPPGGGSVRPGRVVLAGLALGAAAWIKDEPVVLIPVAFLYLGVADPRPGRWFRHASLLVGTTALVIAPWTIRNYRHFGELIPMSANGGIAFWHGNHPRGGGGENLRVVVEHRQAYRRATQALTTIAASKAGWRLGLQAIRDDPARWLHLMWLRVRRTYAHDATAAIILRGGVEPRLRHPRLPPDGLYPYATLQRLVRVANAYWFAMLGLAALGLTTVRRWRPSARVLVLGPLAAWLATHALILGGARYHVPETPFLALAAACGLDRLRLLGRGRP